MRHGLAMAITILLVIGAFADVLRLIASALAQFTANLPTLKAGFDEQIATWESALAARGINITGTATQLGLSGSPIVQLVATVDTLRVPTQQQHRVAYVYD